MKREIRDCKTRETGLLGGMSDELRQNARQTMGELRDFMRETGITWEFFQKEIDRANHRAVGIGRALDKMNQYSTGPGRSLRDLPGNVR